jgi:hypothetical protein
MASSLAEDVIFILFFYAVFTILNTLVPYIYKFFYIHPDNHALIIWFWIIFFAIVAVIFKDIQEARYRKEINDIDDIFQDRIGGFNL